MIGYQIAYTLSLDEENTANTGLKGRFVLATNQLDKDMLPNADVLSECKAQSDVECSLNL